MGITPRRTASVIGAAVAIIASTVFMSGAPDAAAQADALNVLIIGDSYSAGNGAKDYYGVDECHRSSEVWGEAGVPPARGRVWP